MPYKRKTVDTFELQADYGFGEGYECLTSEKTRREAQAQRKCYRENGDYAPMRIKKVRIPITESVSISH